MVDVGGVVGKRSEAKFETCDRYSARFLAIKEGGGFQKKKKKKGEFWGLYKNFMVLSDFHLFWSTKNSFHHVSFRPGSR